MPRWYTDAKLGIFVHWGDYTAFMRDLKAGEDTRGRVPYAEWYLNALRVPGSRTARRHRTTYGEAIAGSQRLLWLGARKPVSPLTIGPLS